VPTLPDTTAGLLDPKVQEQAVINSLLGTGDEGTPYPPPTQNVMPVQETSPPRPTPPQPRSSGSGHGHGGHGHNAA
jgi:hypothetical protein